MASFPYLALKLNEADMLPCMSKQVLGVECPGCGLQRSVALLLEGDILASFLMYPGLFPMMSLFLFIGLNKVFHFVLGPKIISVLGILTVSTILLNFVLKIII